jgi:exoribonuclease-2
MNLKEGSLIEFKDKKRISSLICLKVDPKNIRVVNESNKEFNLPINKVAHVTDTSISISKSRIEIIDSLKKYDSLIESRLNEVVLSDLWEILVDVENEKYTLKQLADLYFGDNTEQERSVILRVLTDDSIYFDTKNDGFYFPKNRKAVELILQQRAAEEQRQKQKELTIQWLKDIWNGDNSPKPDGADKLIELLKDIAVFETRSEKYNEGASIFHEIGIIDGTPQENAISLLTKAGIFQPDQNMLMLEYNIPVQFSNAILDNAEKIESDISSEITNRKDFRNIYTITVDDEDTKDIDDAISLLQLENGGYKISIHIADPAHFILPDTLLDKEAYSRATTIYLPERKIEMLPANLSEDICSLVEGQDRLALTVDIEFNSVLEVVNYDIFESVINVDKRYSYNDADLICSSDDMFVLLSQLSTKLKSDRLNQGAIIFNFPELKIKITEDNKVVLGKYKQNSPSQQIISELMVLSNSLAGEFCNKNKIPCIYRYQDEPVEVVEPDEKLPNIVSMFRQRRFMKKSEVSTIPSEHHGLGLKFYTQMTSPIRRYSDLVIHRQIKNFLREGKPLYNEEQVREVINFSEHSISICNLIQRNSIRYWLCKYLIPYKGFKTNALVLDLSEDKYIVHLYDFCTELPFPKDFGYKFEPGQEIEVMIRDIHIRKGIIIIKPLKEPKPEIEKIEI